MFSKKSNDIPENPSDESQNTYSEPVTEVA
ncbi:MAG: hypothetical protein RIQ30_1553, partial [Pseudomonadota bacterium]